MNIINKEPLALCAAGLLLSADLSVRMVFEQGRTVELQAAEEEALRKVAESVRLAEQAQLEKAQAENTAAALKRCGPRVAALLTSPLRADGLRENTRPVISGVAPQPDKFFLRSLDWMVFKGYSFYLMLEQ